MQEVAIRLVKERERERIRKNAIDFVTYQRSRPPDNLALVIVLGTMARTYELLFCSIPWHHTAEMCADCVDAIGC
jgi:hypothetical protein